MYGNSQSPFKSKYASGGGRSQSNIFQRGRGRYLNGVWYCDCEPRLPGDHFQTRNGRVNHGRWFYTCQKPQIKRCGFFLWDDDARVREEKVVLQNGNSEKESPFKMSALGAPGLPTPATSERSRGLGAARNHSDPLATPSKKGRNPVASSPSKGLFTDDDDDDSFGWDEDLDKEVGKLVQPNFTPHLPPETPRKAPRTDTLTSPGKRKLADMEGYAGSSNSSTRIEESSIPSFPLTPSTSSRALRQPSPSRFTPQTDSLRTTSSVGQATPTPSRFSTQGLLTPRHDAPSSSYAHQRTDISSHCPLATATLTLLDAHKVSLSKEAKDDLLSLLDRHDLKTQGIARGREITRVALQKKDEKVKELMGRIEELEAEKELGKAAIVGLKMDRAGSW